MTDDPRLIRWTPQQHYDVAAHALAEIPYKIDEVPHIENNPETQLCAQLAIAHSLLGILRQLEIIAAQQNPSPLQR